MFRLSAFGRLEMFHDQNWGTICDHGFNKASGDVACNQLGFREAGWHSNYFKISRGNWNDKLRVETGPKLKVHLDDVRLANFC